jgi:hypothetical protein
MMRARTARHRRPIDSSDLWLLTYAVGALYLGVCLTYAVVVNR